MAKIEKKRELVVATLLVVLLLVLPLVPLASALATSSPELWRIINQSSPHPNSYQGFVGDELKITGTNFNQDGIKVNFGSTQVAPSWKNNNEIYINVPDVAKDKTYPISITNGTETSNVQNFYVTLTASSTPELWRIINIECNNLYNGVVGDRLKLTGANLDQPGIMVKFGSTQVTPISKTAGEILIKVPDVAKDKTYPISITNGTETSNVQDFYVGLGGNLTPAPEPTPEPTPTPEPIPVSSAPELWLIINQSSSISASYQGSVGDELKITGVNLDQTGIKVNFGPTQVVPVSKTASEIIIKVPDVAAGQSHPVSITNGTETSSVQDFYVGYKL